MNISITDWSHFSQVLPLAIKYHVGLEISEFASPKNLDQAEGLAARIKEQVAGLPLVSMHGPFSELVPASRDPLIRQVTRQPIRPERAEIEHNPRARSARLRVAEKLDTGI